MSYGGGTSIFLYIFGTLLVVTAVVVLLQGLGILQSIPSYVIWALVLFSVGSGILAALNRSRPY